MEDENLIVKKLIARRSIIHTHAPLPGVYRKEKERATNITNAFLSAPALLTDRDQVCAIAPLFCMRGAGGVAVRGSRLGEDKGVTGGLCRPKEGEGGQRRKRNFASSDAMHFSLSDISIQTLGKVI